MALQRCEMGWFSPFRAQSKDVALRPKIARVILVALPMVAAYVSYPLIGPANVDREVVPLKTKEPNFPVKDLSLVLFGIVFVGCVFSFFKQRHETGDLASVRPLAESKTEDPEFTQFHTEMEQRIKNLPAFPGSHDQTPSVLEIETHILKYARGEPYWDFYSMAHPGEMTSVGRAQALISSLENKNRFSSALFAKVLCSGDIPPFVDSKILELLEKTPIYRGRVGECLEEFCRSESLSGGPSETARRLLRELKKG